MRLRGEKLLSIVNVFENVPFFCTKETKLL